MYAPFQIIKLLERLIISSKRTIFYTYFIQPVHDQLLTLLMKSIRFLSAKSVLYHYQRRSIRSECIQFWMNYFDNLVTSQIISIQIFYGKKKLVSNKTTRHKF